MYRRFGQVDLATGEVVEDGVFVLQRPFRPVVFKEWFMGSAAAFEAVAKAGLNGEAMRVLFFLLARLDFENWVHLTHGAIAEALGMKRPHVTRAFKALVEAGVVLRGPKLGAVQTWRLNPHFVWRGSTKSHRQAMNEKAKARGFRVIEGFSQGELEI